ncbi:unnamed protein product, partial [Brenthis ino]
MRPGKAFIKMATEAILAQVARWPPRQVQTYLDNALSLGTLQNTVCIHRPHPKKNIYIARGGARGFPCRGARAPPPPHIPILYIKYEIFRT